jgi:hypothetical protein
VAKKKRRPQPPRGRPAAREEAAATPKLPVVIQVSRAVRIYAGVFGVAFFVLLVLNAFSVRSARLSIVPLVLVALGTLVCARIFRASLLADERGVVVRNYLRTYRLHWDDVADFRLDAPASRIEGWEMSVIRSNGREIRLDALRRPLVRNVESNRPILEAQRKKLVAWLR